MAAVERRLGASDCANAPHRPHDRFVAVCGADLAKWNPTRVLCVGSGCYLGRDTSKQEANVKVQVRRVAARWDLVDVDVENPGVREDQLHQADLLACFPPRRLLQIAVVGLDVPAGLKPQPQLGVKDEQERSAIGAEHEGAGREMARVEVATGQARGSCRQEGPHVGNEPLFALVVGQMPFQKAAKSLDSLHDRIQARRRREHTGPYLCYFSPAL